ncbi:MAG: hypothetical protein IJC78_05865 [Clostridia bacterium]|nr:hypothetical protein [Clostridia bacterium]
MSRKDNRIKRNLISGMVYQVVLIGINFLLPMLYLKSFGSEVNGVLTTIKDIFMYLTLLEAGVGLATTQALYKPVAEKNRENVSSILSATSAYYTRTGIIYAALVMVIAVVYSFFVPTEISGGVIFTLILLNALPALFSYFIQAKYRILMEVDGRKYVITNSETALQFLSSVGKLLVLLLTDSVVLIQLVYCVLALIQLGYLYYYAKKQYSWLNLKEKPDFKAISQSKSVLVHQISAMVFQHTDVLLLSGMCGFKVVSVYNIYNLFFYQVQMFITNIVNGFSFKLGQMFQTDREQFMKVFRVYETFYIMTTFMIYTLMAVFLLPVVQIYTKGVTDINYSNVALVFLFVLMNLLSNGKLPSNHVLEYSGTFEATRSHAVIEMIINIAVSIVAILKWGICGAVVGTIAALLYRGTMMIYYANRKVLGRSIFCTYRLWLQNGAVFAGVMLILFVDSFSGVSFGTLVLNGLLHSVWIVGAYALVNFMFEREAFRTLISLYRGKKA